MKKSDIYEVTIKILGIYLFYLATMAFKDLLSLILMFIQLKKESGGLDFSTQLMYSIAPIGNLVFTTVLAMFLTFKTRAVVKLVCIKEDFNESASLFADRKVIYEIALVIIGLPLTISTIPELILSIKNLIDMKLTNVSGLVHYRDLIPSVSKIIVGVLLFLFSKTVSRWLGRDKSNTSETIQ